MLNKYFLLKVPVLPDYFRVTGGAHITRYAHFTRFYPIQTSLQSEIARAKIEEKEEEEEEEEGGGGGGGGAEGGGVEEEINLLAWLSCRP